jgi:cold shock CspA family protein
MDDKDFGKIIFRNEDGGYGFLRPDSSSERDVFFHAALSEEVRIGDRVTFETGTDKLYRPCAKNARVVNGDQQAAQDELQQAAADYQRKENPLSTRAPRFWPLRIIKRLLPSDSVRSSAPPIRVSPRLEGLEDTVRQRLKSKDVWLVRVKRARDPRP